MSVFATVYISNEFIARLLGFATQTHKHCTHKIPTTHTEAWPSNLAECSQEYLILFHVNLINVVCSVHNLS